MDQRKCMLQMAITGLFLLLPFVAAITPVVASDVQVIVNKDVTIHGIDAKTLISIYVGAKSTWDNGTKIRLATLAGSGANSNFLKT